MKEKKLKDALLIYHAICKRKNEELERENPNYNAYYEVLQQSSLFQEENFEEKIATLYNSFHKNKDFIHIPDIKTIEDNSLKYPSIIARRKDTNELIGIATLKYFENEETEINPYFPFQNAKYFELSGLLVREDNIQNGLPGIGKAICELAITGASIYHRNYPDTTMITVIDVRNAPSMNAMRKALQMIKENQIVGENLELAGHIIGYYEVHDFETDQLTEAQTLVIEFNLMPQLIQEKKRLTIEIKKKETEPLTTTINQKLQETFKYCPIIKGEKLKDENVGNVIFYQTPNPYYNRIENLTLIPHNSAEGNDRKIKKTLINTENYEIKKNLKKVYSI